MPSLILASQSASRKHLLKQAGVDFTAESPGVDEGAIKQKFRAEKKTVEETAFALATSKADAVAAKHKGALVLGADQMLECEGRWLDKAKDAEEAKKQLRFLSGKTHRLITAAALIKNGRPVWKELVVARLHVRKLSDAFIDDYCQQLRPELLKSVGCYALEGPGIQLFERVEGDFFGILGLPLVPLLKALREQGMLLN